MNKTLRSMTAAALTVAGLLTVVSLPAAAAVKPHKYKAHICYELTATALKSARVTTKGCPKGYSPTKPNLQGTGLAGDIDLKVPGTASLAINGSSFDAPEVGATTSGSSAYTAGGQVSFSSYPAAGSGTGRTDITNSSVNIGFSDQPMTATAGTLPSGVTESNYVQVPYILGGAVIGYNLGQTRRSSPPTVVPVQRSARRSQPSVPITRRVTPSRSSTVVRVQVRRTLSRTSCTRPVAPPSPSVAM